MRAPAASPAPLAAPSPLPAVPTPASGAAPPSELIRLDRPFDVDEVSQLLGETSIHLRVPRENLDEVLRRVTEFMGFGVYVYSIAVRPADSASLKEFEVDLQRVDFVPARGRWEPFVERGTVPGP